MSSNGKQYSARPLSSKSMTNPLPYFHSVCLALSVQMTFSHSAPFPFLANDQRPFFHKVVLRHFEVQWSGSFSYAARDVVM